MGPTPLTIDRAIMDAVLSGRIRAGMRLGEQALASLFDVSRTAVREALIRLETRGIVNVSPRRGWFVIEPSLEEAQDAFRARRAIEGGVLQSIGPVEPYLVTKLRDHIGREREAIAGDDVATRSFLLADFHICLTEACGHTILADILRDLTARTMLISSLYQSSGDASRSCDEHQDITDVLAKGDLRRAADLMSEHIGNVEAGLTKRIENDPLFDLRHALQMPAEKR